MGYELGLQGKFDEAMQHLYNGIDKLRKAGNEYVAMQGYFNMAIVLRLQQRYTEAIKYLDLVQDIVHNHHVQMNMMYLYEEMALALEGMGNYKDALEYQRKYQAERERAHRFDKATAERA
jgi:tetratricopeptide (TPR) repeat protein